MQSWARGVYFCVCKANEIEENSGFYKIELETTSSLFLVFLNFSCLAMKENCAIKINFRQNMFRQKCGKNETFLLFAKFKILLNFRKHIFAPTLL